MSILQHLWSPDPAPRPPSSEPVASPHADLPVLDATVQQELAAVGGAGLPKELLAMFLADAPNQLAGVRAGLATGDLLPVRKLAHSMKGAAASIGAARVEASARALEHAARAGETAQLPELTEIVATTLAELGTHLD